VYNSDTGRALSSHALPKSTAEAQLRALYASIQIRNEGFSGGYRSRSRSKSKKSRARSKSKRAYTSKSRSKSKATARSRR
jgi:hypothetical protein